MTASSQCLIHSWLLQNLEYKSNNQVSQTALSTSKFQSPHPPPPRSCSKNISFFEFLRLILFSSPFQHFFDRKIWRTGAFLWVNSYRNIIMDPYYSYRRTATNDSARPTPNYPPPMPVFNPKYPPPPVHNTTYQPEIPASTRKEPETASVPVSAPPTSIPIVRLPCIVCSYDGRMRVF